MREFSFLTTYYSQPRMLQRHLEEWEHYPPEVSFLLVDDGSPVPAERVVEAYAGLLVRDRLRVYRILEDIPWARSTARNLGMQEAATPWCVVTDLDHLLPAANAQRLLAFTPMPGAWYRFPRYRRGRADETRHTDALPRDCPWGRIHPHRDSYLIERGLYWDVGGYNEQVFNGVRGGGAEFLSRLTTRAPERLLPEEVFLEVYTREVIPDASVTTLSRHTAESSRRRTAWEARGTPKPEVVVILPWERVL